MLDRKLLTLITRSFVGGSDAFGTFSEIDRQTYEANILVWKEVTQACWSHYDEKEVSEEAISQEKDAVSMARTKEIISEGDVDFRYYFNQMISGLIIHH